jgi:uncharacterized protein with ATP-grasp and redox domains
LISPIASRTIGPQGESGRSADNTIMKRLIAIAVVLVAGSASVVWAQAASGKPIAEVAKAEEARRKSVKKPAKVYTNGSLTPDTTKGVAPPPAATTPPPVAGNSSPSKPAETAKPAAEDPKSQEYWTNRINAARSQLQRTQMFADSLQSRINALLTDFVNRDDPAQRAKIEGDRKAALAELEKVKKELDEQNKAIAAIMDEARRAGVPAGWLRPGV